MLEEYPLAVGPEAKQRAERDAHEIGDDVVGQMRNGTPKDSPLR